MAVVCLTALGRMLTIAWQQTQLPIHLRLLFNRLETGMVISHQHKQTQVHESMEQLREFILKNPHEWRVIIGELLGLIQ